MATRLLGERKRGAVGDCSAHQWPASQRFFRRNSCEFLAMLVAAENQIKCVHGVGQKHSDLTRRVDLLSVWRGIRDG